MNEIELGRLRVELLRAAIKKTTTCTRARPDGNQTEFGKLLGYKDGAHVRQMLSGERPVSEKTIRLIEELPGMAGWFTGRSEFASAGVPSFVHHGPPGSGAPINAPKGVLLEGLPGISAPTIKDSLETSVGEPLVLRSGRAVAVVGEVQGSPDGEISIDDYPAGVGHGWIDIYTTDSLAYGLKVRGDGMRPRIKSGEHIVIEPGIKAEPGDDVLVKFSDGSAVVKELLWIRDGEVCLGSVSSAIPPITRPLDAILSVHRIAAVIHRGSGMYRAE